MTSHRSSTSHTSPYPRQSRSRSCEQRAWPTSSIRETAAAGVVPVPPPQRLDSSSDRAVTSRGCCRRGWDHGHGAAVWMRSNPYSVNFAASAGDPDRSGSLNWRGIKRSISPLRSNEVLNSTKGKPLVQLYVAAAKKCLLAGWNRISTKAKLVVA